MTVRLSKVLFLVASVAVFTAVNSGCESHDRTPPRDASKPTASGPAKPVAKPIAESASQPQKRSADGCVGPFTASPTKQFSIAGRDWELTGSTLTQKTHNTENTMNVGVIADIKEDSPENLTNLDHLISFFKQEKVDFIFVDGDTGETKSQVANSLRRLAQSGLPVGIIIGNRECRNDFNAAVTEIQAKYQNVFNLNAVRRIVTDDAEFLTMPGYYNPDYLHCVQDGCEYYEEDVMALAPLIDQATHPVTLISHGPPRQSAPTGIDRISEGSNEGDPSLTKLISEKHVPFGLFANIHEAGGKATNLAGDVVIKEGVMVDSMYLNPGPADSVRWAMNDHTESVGMAAIVTYKGKLASYKIHRIGAPPKLRR